MRMLVGTTMALWIGVAGAGLAQSQSQPAVVVELFTSQGCSSCPPADDYLAGIAGRDDVIALALHVDYWDYIGWKDTFANPAFTDRQHAYASAAGARSVYTPQVVVDGVDHVIGNSPGEVAALIRDHAAAGDRVAVKLGRRGGRVTVEATATGAVPKGALVQLVRYRPEATVDIRRGENAGRSITYHNIVTGIDVLGKWDGAAPFRADAPAGDGPVVVIVQGPKMGPILGAARLR